MQLKTFALTLKTEEKIIKPAAMLRAHLASLFPDYVFLHHHDNKKNLIYAYPRVQYKVIDGTPIILGIEEGTELLRQIYPQINQLELGGSDYRVIEKTIVEKDVDFGITNPLQKYKFLSPWLALNKENYKKYSSSNGVSQTKLLKKILIGNIISMAKSLEYVVTEEIRAKIRVRPIPVSLKNIPMIGFLGTFQMNFNLPDYIGLGKSVSRGFGTIKRSNRIL